MFTEPLGEGIQPPLSTFDIVRLLDIHASYGGEFIGTDYMYNEFLDYDLSQVVGREGCSPLASPPNIESVAHTQRLLKHSCSVDGTGELKLSYG